MNDLINEELIENTYFFCLKRISDSDAAQDLSQNILCAALSAIHEGKKFTDFYAWYWRMARNKYADYIRGKQNPALPIECAGGAVSEAIPTLERIVADEERSALHYALSRLAASQREIVIRFYLKEQPVAQIAHDLDLPVGTVKRRLFDVRQTFQDKAFQERMDHMNTYGKTSFAPAEVSCFYGYDAGSANAVMNNRIAQQTVVICREEPRSINEIADEMGVAPVYLEQVLDAMLQNALLKKCPKDKYQTNFCVFPKQAYTDASYAAHQAFRESGYPEKITGLLLSMKDQITALDFYGNDFDYSYLMWLLYVYAGDRFGTIGLQSYLAKYKDRFPNETERSYRITAEYVLPEETIQWPEFKSMGWSNLHQHFQTSGYGRLEYVNNFDASPLPVDRDAWINGNNISLLMALAADPAKPLNSYEEEMASDLISKGLLEKTEGGLKVTLPIISRKTEGRIYELIENAIGVDATVHAARVGEEVEKILLPHVRKDLMSNFIHWDMRLFFQPIRDLFYYGLYDSDTLFKPEDCDRSAAGLYILTE